MKNVFSYFGIRYIRLLMEGLLPKKKKCPKQNEDGETPNEYDEAPNEYDEAPVYV